MAKTLTCPSCAVSLSSSSEFTAMQKVDSFKHWQVIGVTSTGALEVEGIDHSFGDALGPLLISCSACGHEWATTREMS